MSSLSFTAIRVGHKPPANYLKTGEIVVCPECGATFSISRVSAFVAEKLLPDQIAGMKEILGGEHVDDKFSDHLVSYEVD